MTCFYLGKGVVDPNQNKIWVWAKEHNIEIQVTSRHSGLHAYLTGWCIDIEDEELAMVFRLKFGL